MDGEIIGGRYEIVRRIGAGGSARVYLARDLVLKRDVAVKILHEEEAQDPSFVKRFQREAQSAARLNHPNIVSVYDWGSVGSTYYMVMEAVNGRNLKEEIAHRGPLPEEEALTIAERIASALETAHSHGVIHRDVKPHNILLDEAGRVKVADFGIARATGLTQLTSTNMVAGTASYISPEQARGQQVDERSDIYSLGVLLWELLAGRELFNGSSMVEIALRHVNEAAPPLRQVRPDISPLTEAIVAKALAKDPVQRYQSAAAMGRALADAREALRVPATVAIPLVEPRESRPRVAATRRPPSAVTDAAPVRSRVQTASAPTSRGWLAALLALALLIAGGGGLLAAEHGAFGTASRTNGTPAAGTLVAASHPGHRPTSTPTPPPTATPTPAPAPAPTKVPAAALAPPGHHPKPRPTPTPPAPTPTPPVPTPTPPPSTVAPTQPPPSSLAANTPQATVKAFYTLISNHQFQQAAALWTPSMRQQFPPASNINGRFGATRQISVVEDKLLSETGNSATVQVDLLEVHGAQTQQWGGTWNLVPGPNGWLLSYPNLRQLSP